MCSGQFRASSGFFTLVANIFATEEQLESL